MNKANFIAFIADKNRCTKAEAERIIDSFTDAVISAFENGEEVSLVGFGNFYAVNFAERNGRNPRTGQPIKIAAYKQPKFKPGQKLRDACNK